MKELMYNPGTGDLLVTKAKADGKVYQSYLTEGYIKIGLVDGFNVVVKGIGAKLIDQASKTLERIFNQLKKIN